PRPLAGPEVLAAEPDPRRFPPGAVVIREGEPGDHFYLIVEGSAAVSVHGAPRPSLRRGDCFGEIALLRDIPRTATITAEQPLRTLALGREEFLTAVTGNSMSKAAADALAAERLSTDPATEAMGLLAHDPSGNRAGRSVNVEHDLAADAAVQQGVDRRLRLAP